MLITVSPFITAEKRETEELRMEMATVKAVKETALPYRRLKRIWKYKLLYVLLLPACTWVFIFDYLPLHGIRIAFMDYNSIQGYAGSHWAGFKYFRMLVGSEMFRNSFKNTLIISLYKMISGFVCPIVLALAFKRNPYQRVQKNAADCRVPSPVCLPGGLWRHHYAPAVS
jgi:ABC-type polysaccharide transport system permease subunit